MPNKPPCDHDWEDIKNIQSCQICCNQDSPKFLAVNSMEGIAFVVNSAKNCAEATKAAKELWPHQDKGLQAYIVSCVLAPCKPAPHPLWPSPKLSCTKCGKEALFIACDALGLEWFECGEHGPLDNLAEVERVALTPIDKWLENLGLEDLEP